MFKRWWTIIQTCNLPEGMTMEEADPVSKWLVVSRACVFSMTLTSGIIGGLIALSQGAINWWYWLVTIIGLTLAHASLWLTKNQSLKISILQIFIDSDRGKKMF